MHWKVLHFVQSVSTLHILTLEKLVKKYLTVNLKQGRRYLAQHEQSCEGKRMSLRFQIKPQCSFRPRW